MKSLRPSFVTDELEEQFMAYALKQYPHEACAYIKNGKLVTVTNIHPEPENYFQLTKKNALACTKAQGFLHSHPNGKPVPSHADLESSIGFAIPFGVLSVNPTGCSPVIWWGDHLLDYELIGRPFVDNVMDCWELTRAVYWQHRHVKLPNLARDADFWKQGQDLFPIALEKGKFVEVHDLQPYDVITMCFRADFGTHSAVYLGNNKIIHHLQFKPSQYDLITRYDKMIYKVYRYIG